MSRKLAKELVVARQHLLLLVNDVVLRESNLPVTSCPLSLRVIPAADVCLQNGLHCQISSRRTKRSVLCSHAFCFSPCPVLFALRPLPSRLPNMLARSTTLCSRRPTVMLQNCCALPSAFCSRSRRCLCFYNVFPPVTPCCPEVQCDLPHQGGVRRRPRTYVFLLCWRPPCRGREAQYHASPWEAKRRLAFPFAATYCAYATCCSACVAVARDAHLAAAENAR